MWHGEDAESDGDGGFLAKDAMAEVVEKKARVAEKVSFATGPTSLGTEGEDGGGGGCIGDGQRGLGLVDIEGESACVLRQFCEGVFEVRMATDFGKKGTEGLLDAPHEMASPFLGGP